MDDKTQNPTCQYKYANYQCDEPVADGQKFCICHRSERTPEELDRFHEIVKERMAAKNYDFVGFFFPDGFAFGDEVCFEGPADFSDATFEGNVDFGGATFEDDARFEDAKFKDKSSQSVFMDTRFQGYTGFDNVNFEGDALFAGARFVGSAWFIDTTFGACANFDGAVFGSSCDFKVAKFEGEADFSAVSLPQVGIFHPAREMRKGRRIKPGRGESFCRFAKQVLQNMGHYREAGDYHYEERCHSWYRRAWLEKTGIKRFLRLLNLILSIGLIIEYVFGRILFGYGERPGRIAWISLGLVALFAGAYDWSEAIVHSSGEGLSGYWNSLYFSAVTFTTLGFGDYSPMYGNPIAWLTALEAFAGVFLMAAFLVTLARRWGRG